VTKVHGKGEGAVVALDEVSVTLPSGSFTTIMGPSGSGKSTFLHVAAGLDRPDEGAVTFGDTELTRLSERRLTILRRERNIFAFTSIAVVNTLVMIALRRGRELALLRLTGSTNRQVRSMARWEAALIVAIGLGVGLAIAATALVPLSHSLTGDLRPYIPIRQVAAILGVSTLLAVVALAIPARRALRKRPITALASAE
jgi:predicted ABC-type transport system involved in lysophospholipase L1 biosynthesis ATPase subunit